jgi:multidrug resistance efflux pump
MLMKAAAQKPGSRSSRALPAPARAGFMLWIVSAILALSVVGGWWWWSAGDAKPEDDTLILHQVSRGDFSLSITERGEIESAGVTEITSQVKSKNTSGVAILRIVPEGTVVKKGDFMVELDSSAFAEERTTQQIAVNTAEALVVEARNIYETALIAKQEYLEGTYVQERQTIESEVFVAEENLNRAKEYYEYSKKLAGKGYVNQLQLEADKFAVEKSKKELDAAKTKLKVLDDFTKAKMLKQLESDIVIAKSKWESEKSSYDLASAKLQEIEDQIGKCTIKAPRDGTVVYAHNRQNWGGDDFIVKEGALIRERQAIIHLPDPGQMQVNLNVNESLIQYVRPGMPATIIPVGAGDRVLHGTVTNVNQYAEPSGWRKANIKEYKAQVTIAEAAEELRSGMTASVTIHCADVANVVQAPVQSVYAHGKDYYAFVYHDGAWEARALKCGPTNDKFFVIEDGLKEGDRVSMNPRAYVSQVKLPALPPEKKEQIARGEPQSPDSPESTAPAIVKTAGEEKGDSVAQANDGEKKEKPARRPKPVATTAPAAG